MIIKENIPLKELNSFGIAAKARYYGEFFGEEDLRSFFANNTLDWYILSGGSNILLTKDYNGVMLKPKDSQIKVVFEDSVTVKVNVSAACDWDYFVGYAVSRGWYGMENLSYIPGLVGAAPVQNIGAYGSEAKDVIESVLCYLPYEDKLQNLSNNECLFGYRDSVFKRELKGKAIVLSVLFSLKKEYSPLLGYGDLEAGVKALGGVTAENVRSAVIDTRKRKLPDPKKVGNGGSFFKNPVISCQEAEELKNIHPDMPSFNVEGGVKIPAAWLIDKAGWKGFRRGDAGVHINQPLVLVNYAEATGEQVLALAYDIQKDIETKFGVSIHPEINIL